MKNPLNLRAVDLLSPVFWALLVTMVLIAITYSCSVTSCDRVCSMNGHRYHYEALGGGCFCRDEKGLYNPRDSRER